MLVNLEVNIGTLKLKNPIMVASGTFGYGEEFNENFYPIKELGAVITKGISRDPWPGNPMPRTVETASGMLNAIGMQNIGVEKFIKEKLPYLRKSGATIIVNVLGKTADEYAEVAGMVAAEEGVAAIELNISCPNVKAGGQQFGTDSKSAAAVTKEVRKRVKKTLIVKLSPNVADIAAIGAAVADAGADAISAINSVMGMAIDIKKRRPVLANTFGGLSGPAIKPIALRMVWQLCRKVKIPVIGIGGISSLTDIVEFLLAGASAIEIGTANLVDPMIAHRLVGELKNYCKENKITGIYEMKG